MEMISLRNTSRSKSSALKHEPTIQGGNNSEKHRKKDKLYRGPIKEQEGLKIRLIGSEQVTIAETIITTAR